MSSTHAVREDEENKSSGSGLGIALAVVAVGVGFGAALYHFFKPTPETATTATPYASNSHQDDQQRNFRNRAWSLEMCSICTEAILIGASANSIMLSCGHKFHNACIKPWTDRNNNCPNCRKTI